MPPKDETTIRHIVFWPKGKIGQQTQFYLRFFSVGRSYPGIAVWIAILLRFQTGNRRPFFCIWPTLVNSLAECHCRNVVLDGSWFGLNSPETFKKEKNIRTKFWSAENWLAPTLGVFLHNGSHPWTASSLPMFLMSSNWTELNYRRILSWSTQYFAIRNFQRSCLSNPSGFERRRMEM